MARKPNYDYEKRRKEMERKAKKDSRREEKRLRREQNGGEGGGPPIDGSILDDPIDSPTEGSDGAADDDSTSPAAERDA